MARQAQIGSVLNKLSKRLGRKLVGRMGRGRLVEVATNIADYKEQVGWENTPQELRRLADKIHHIPAQLALNLGAVRLSRDSQVAVDAALWGTLKSVFPTLEIRPTH